jgi:AraC-like DNA-binding protein
MPNLAMVFARSVRKIANAVAPRGDSDHLLRTVGLERDAIHHPSFRIPYADMMMLTEHAARMTEDEAFGLHVGERVEMSEYGVIGSSIVTSATLGEALRTLVRFLPIWTDVGVFSLEVDGPVACFRWEYSERSLPEPRHDCEMSLATLARFSGFSNRVRMRTREVWFQHAKPRDTSEHARIFRAPAHFGMPANALLFDSQVLDVALPSSDPSLHKVSVQTAEQLLMKSSGEASFSQCVLSFIRRELDSGNFDLDAAARHLGLSRRTLQRRLGQESCSYRELVQQARSELSQFLLRGASRTATETAYALGYSEPSAFQRAFHKWHGMPPGAYRES